MPCSCSMLKSITDKTNAADLSSGVFAILIMLLGRKKYKIHCYSTKFVKNGQANSHVIKEVLN